MIENTHQALKEGLETKYGEDGLTAWNNICQWLNADVPLVPQDALAAFLRGAPLDLIYESFWRILPFGTGGVRGTVGFGPNRINPTVVALTIQAHCDYMTEFLRGRQDDGLQRAVVIANDVREFHDVAGTLKFMDQNPYHAVLGAPGLKTTSRYLAYLAAGVYAKNGFTVYIEKPHDHSAFLTTPELSFLIRWLKCAGGINLSASHNPPDDNGVKVYDENGGQYLPPYDQDLTDRARAIRRASHMSYDDAVAAGLVKDIPEEALAAYMSLYLDRAHARKGESVSGSRILFTPLGGCGERTVKIALDRLGYLVHVPEREGPTGAGPDGTHGTFGAIPMRIANPEVPESTRESKIAAAQFGASLVLASDPDADRLGVEVLHDGQWRHLTGNQIATILAYYLLLDPAGPRLRGGVYETAVTTLAVSAIAERAECHPIVNNLLVGFKYIGNCVFQYQRSEGGAALTDTELLAFATEESHGFLDTPHLRDKDAMSGALTLARLHEKLLDSGETLVDYLAHVYREVGDFGDVGRSMVILGSRGFRAIHEVMEVLRSRQPTVVGGVRVVDVVDRRDVTRFGAKASETGWEARNLLTYSFDGGRISLRPSGTEPKLKFYAQTTTPGDVGSAQEYAEKIADELYQQLLRTLSEIYEPIALRNSFARLPDVISLDGKLELQNVTAARFREEVAAKDYDEEWLARRLSEWVGRIVAGDAAWQVVEKAFTSLAAEWGDEAQERTRSVFARLRRESSLWRAAPAPPRSPGSPAPPASPASPR